MGRGSGKDLNSRYGGHWKLQKVFFNESVSTILQLVVVIAMHGSYVTGEIEDSRKTKFEMLCMGKYLKVE